MRKQRTFALCCILLALLLIGCGNQKKHNRGPLSEKWQSSVTPTLTEGLTPTDVPEPTETPTPTGAVESPTPTGATAPTEAPKPTTPIGELKVGDYTEDGRIYIGEYTKKQVIDFFDDVAMNVEYGYSRNVLRKWIVPIYLSVDGETTEKDRETIERLMDYFNSVEGFPGMSYATDSDEANSFMHFLPGDEYEGLRSQYIDEWNTGGFANGTYHITANNYAKAIIGIRSGEEQYARTTVILEETIQSLGLFNDTYLDPESIFYQGYNDMDWPTEMDLLMVKCLYHPSLECGMGQDEVNAILEEILIEKGD